MRVLIKNLKNLEGETVELKGWGVSGAVFRKNLFYCAKGR